MYDELVKSLRQCAEAQCAGCKNDLVQIGCRGLLQHEAADAIEELQAQLMFSNDAAKAIAEKVPKWIPVTEQLPEPNAVDKYGFAKGYLVKTDRHVMMHTARYNGEWWILWGKAEVITDTVTHWQPLPEPPKEES